MKIKQENEITYYTEDININIMDVVSNFLNEVKGSDASGHYEYKYKDYIYFMFEAPKGDKDKLTIKLSNGILYFKKTIKTNVDNDSLDVETYEEKQTDWQEIGNLELEYINRPIYSFYYKEKYKINFEYENQKFKIIGDKVSFLNLESQDVKRKINYIEIEGKKQKNFTKEVLDYFSNYFIKENEFESIDYLHSKFGAGKEVIGTEGKNNLNIKSADEFKNFLLNLYT